MMNSRSRSFLLTAVVVTACSWVSGWSVESPEAAKAELKQIASEVNKLSRAFNLIHQIVAPSVVCIHTKEVVKVADFYTGRLLGSRESDVGEGSGFIIHSDDKYSYILTNSHVVFQINQQQQFIMDSDQQPMRYDRVRVVFNDNQQADAEYVGGYLASDLAMVRVPIPHLPAVQWADSDQAHVGDWVVALGYPLAVGYSATAGIVSATDRSTGIYGGGGFDSFIQTDAAINPGNSGGPLVDIQGRVVGVNSNIISRTGSNIGLGFAIPSNHVQRIVRDLIKYGKVHRSVIGVQIDESKDAVQALVGSVVPDSPASKAGLQVGDVILAVGTTRVISPAQFRSRLSNSSVGDVVPLTIKRHDEELILPVTIESEDALVERLNKAADSTAKRQFHVANFGLTVVDDGRPGLVIASVDEEGLAAAAGLERGDRLMHEKSLGALHALDDAKQLDRKRDVIVQVQKDGRSFWLRMRR